jgi:integrase
VLINAVQDNILSRNPAYGIRLKKTDRLPKYLTLAELQKLIATELENETVRHGFLFSCWTGLRYGDLSALKWDQVRGNVIEFQQRKTGDDNVVPLSQVAIEILAKQKSVRVSRRQKQSYSADLIFKLPKQQSLNYLLKVWALKAGVTKNITFHVARHTFATLALSSGVDIYTTSKLLGHKSIGTTTIYAKIIDEKRVEAVAKLPNIQFSKGIEPY